MQNWDVNSIDPARAWRLGRLHCVLAFFQGDGCDGGALTARSAASVDHDQPRRPLQLTMTKGFARFQARFSKI